MSATSLANKVSGSSLLSGNVGFGTAFEHISSITVGSLGASSVSFTEIPQGYRHLQIRGIVRNNKSGGQSVNDLYARFNNDSGSNYSTHYLQGFISSANVATVSSGAATSQTSLSCGITPQGSGQFAPVVIDILDYSSGVKNKLTRALTGFDQNSTSLESGVFMYSGMWMSTAPVSSISLFQGTFALVQYSTLSLYGIR